MDIACRTGPINEDRIFELLEVFWKVSRFEIGTCGLINTKVWGAHQ